MQQLFAPLDHSSINSVKFTYRWESFCRSWWHSGKQSQHSSDSVLRQQFQRIRPSAWAEHRLCSVD